MVYLHLLGSTSPNLAMVNRSTATPVSNELLMSIAEASGQRIQGRAATGRASQASRNNSSSSKLHGGMGGGLETKPTKQSTSTTQFRWFVDPPEDVLLVYIPPQTTIHGTSRLANPQPKPPKPTVVMYGHRCEPRHRLGSFWFTTSLPKM